MIKDLAEVKAIYDRALPEYPWISTAPGMHDIASINSERDKKYKSFNSETGDAYLIQNPAVWEDGRRPTPQLVMTLADAKKNTGIKSKKSSKDDFWE